MRKTVWVARFPFPPRGSTSWDIESSAAVSRRIQSEVATMRYIETHTAIPIPHVLDYSVETGISGIGSPYILMTKVAGVPLSTRWESMDDPQRAGIIRQVVDILYELSTHRFDSIGSLFQKDTSTSSQGSWYVDSLVCDDTADPLLVKVLTSRPFGSTMDYRVAYATANLQRIADSDFGFRGKFYDYAFAWFLRSLIPSLYDPSLDAAGFPLSHGDFHSQNIMVDFDSPHSEPRITSIVDWEFSGTQPSSSYAQYPLFIIDHPLWDDDDPQRQRSVMDQETFLSCFRKVEEKAGLGSAPLALAYSKSQGIYLLEQTMSDHYLYPRVFPMLLEHIFGSADLFYEGYMRSLENGVLRRVLAVFDQEQRLWEGVRAVLGKGVVPEGMSRQAFASLVQEEQERLKVTSAQELLEGTLGRLLITPSIHLPSLELF